MGATGPEAVPFVSQAVVMAVALVTVAWVEHAGRRGRGGHDHAAQRWVLGIGLWALGALIGGAIAPEARWGVDLFHRWGGMPAALQFLVTLAAMDLVQTGVHRVLHAVPWLWRLHAVHHADARYDAATALRFHPLEAGLRAVPDILLLALLGPDPFVALAVLLFGTVWNVFDHADVRLPPRWSRRLEWLMVTPDFHRLHHATLPALHDRNFGGIFTLWDRLLGWYRVPPEMPAAVGVAGWRAGDDLMANLLAPVAMPDT